MTNQPRFCPHCGNELKSDAKFCPKCGYAVGETTATAEPTPEPTPTEAPTSAGSATKTAAAEKTAAATRTARNAFGNYFSWYFDTLKHPSTPQVQPHRFFGAITMLVEALLLVLSLMVMAQKLVHLAEKTLSSYDTEAAAKYLNLNGLVFKSGLTVFFLLAIGYTIYVAIGYAFRRIITAQPLNFWDFTNQFASVTNLILIFNLVTFFLSLITGPANFSGLTTMVIFMIPASLILSVAFIFTILDNVIEAPMDKFYTVLLAEVSLSVALAVFTLLAVNILGSSLIDSFESLYQSVL